MFRGQIRDAGVPCVGVKNAVFPLWPCVCTYSGQHRLLSGAHRVPILPASELRVGRWFGHFSVRAPWVSCAPTRLLGSLSLGSSKLQWFPINFLRLDRSKIEVCGQVGGGVSALPRRAFGLPTCLLASPSQRSDPERSPGRAFGWQGNLGNSPAHRRIRHNM